MAEQYPGHDSRAIANEILRIMRERKIAPPTIMQLIKLAFFAHGLTLAGLNKPLSKHQAQAWQYGPVFPPIYKAAAGSGSAPITRPLNHPSTGTPVFDSFDTDEAAIIAAVVEGYSGLHAFQLSNLTHAADSPWRRTIDERGVYAAIPNDWIKEYFLKL